MQKNREEKRFGELQAVVFDWAGTTVDFGCQGPVHAFRESFSAFGVEVTPDEVREPMGKGKREHVAAMLDMPRIAMAWKIVRGKAPDAEDLDAVYALVEKNMTLFARRYCVPIPGTVKAVEIMRSCGLLIGSCTGYPRSVGEPLARGAREFGYAPDVLVCATDVPLSRPAPDMCKEALRRLNVHNPARAVKIGDTVNDVLEGLRAGMWVIGITLSGSLAGLSMTELNELSQEERDALHQRISHELMQAGAHFTAPDVLSCLPLLEEIKLRC